MDPIASAARTRSTNRYKATSRIVLTLLLAGPTWAQQDHPQSRPGRHPASTSTTQSQPTSAVAPGSRLLSVQQIFGADAIDFSGSHATGLRWLDDGSYLQRRDGKAMRIDPAGGDATPDFDEGKLRAALKSASDFDDEATERIVGNPGERNRDRSVALVRNKGALYRYNFEDGELKKIDVEAPDSGEWKELSWSPRGAMLSFVHGNNVFTIDALSGRRTKLTEDGDKNHLNGVLDWVYQEEIYGRGDWRAYWWRDDDHWIAFLQLDETDVPVHTIVDPLPVRSAVETLNYPKVDDPNPGVRLGVVRPDGSEKAWIDLGKYGKDEILIVRVGWSPDGMVIFQVQDRLQTWLDLNEADPQTGKMRTLLRETSPAWVNVLDVPHWLPDKSFLWESERDGWRHLYHVARDGALLGRLTQGDWEVRSFHGVSDDGWAYFSGTKDTPTETHAYRVRVNGGEVERLTTPGSNHAASFDRNCRYFVDTFSSAMVPPKVHLRRADGSLVRVISENDVPVLAEFKLSPPEFVRFPARDGYPLYAKLTRPIDGQPGKRNPVWSHVYGGPQSPIVENHWTGRGGMLDQMLVQKGYLIWECDPRLATGGAANAWRGYKKLGVTELEDLEDGIRWLIDQGLADPKRVGITGYSYGGYMTCYAMTHSKMFSVGIAGGSVTDWRNYDSVYTERYMSLAKLNADGYKSSSVNDAVEDLHGRLLLVHGSIDENVHIQNTMQFLEALQQHRKQFDLMIYPHDRHGIGHGAAHFRELQLRYIEEHL
ncbi:MAG: S9 family peptidase [Phycisphaerae bacterium]